ncbi:MAG: thioredoxin family protein [Rubricoccaceae bacterium]
MRSLLLALALVAVPTWAQSDAGLTDVEQAVLETVSDDGVHVVHFWAPWCGNSMAELRAGLSEVVEAHPDVSFTFVTIRNGVENGENTLRRHGIPDRVQKLVQHDASNFLGQNISWTPTTWVFNRGGKLAYAFNYGEVSNAMLTQAIADARNDWHHD